MTRGTQHFASAVYPCVRGNQLSPPSTTEKSICFTCKDSRTAPQVRDLPQPVLLSKIKLKPSSELEPNSRTTPRLQDLPQQNRIHMSKLSWCSTSARPSSASPFVTDMTRDHTFNSPHSRPNLCWLEKVKRHRDTSRCGQRSERREQCEHRGRCAQG